MWAVYIIAAGLPILLVIYCCCFAPQDKYDLKDEDKQPLQVNEEIESKQEEEETEKQHEVEEIIESEETEKQNEVEEIIDSEETDKPAMGGDGPRRRKPKNSL